MGKTYVFNKDVAKLAVRMALPTIRMMAPIASWGPKGVVIGIEGPGMIEPYIHVMEDLENDPDYDKKVEEFRQNVLAKLSVTRRTGRASGHMLHVDPAGLEGNDSLYRGSAELGSLRAAASGFYGEADEYVAWIVLHCAQFICLMISVRMRDYNRAFVRDALPSAMSDMLSAFVAGWQDMPLLGP